eukprot:21057-Heterococcus_DN1.PRE.2
MHTDEYTACPLYLSLLADSHQHSWCTVCYKFMHAHINATVSHGSALVIVQLLVLASVQSIPLQQV